jgi:molybdopterin molybdotransferase
MITVDEALSLIEKHKLNWGSSDRSIDELSSDITAEDLIADRDYPPFHRVMMDGIAVSFNVYKEGKREFNIAGISPAGEPQKTLSDPGTCFEVMTGAPLPEGADLVIPYEHLTIENKIAHVTLEVLRSPLENVHLKGSDGKAGDIFLRTGEKLNGPHWGIAASLGYDKIKIEKKPRINIVSTGDELVPVDQIPLDHQIRRSNAYALKASLNLNGYNDIELSHLNDEEQAIESHYREHSTRFDLMIYSGGVSKGKFDYLPSTWKRLGVKEVFHGIAQRPGKPLWFGIDEKTNTMVVGLPGNPVSSLVCLHRYFLSTKEMYAELTEDITFKKDLTYFIPVRLTYEKNGLTKATPHNIKNSGEFSALAGSDGFLELPKDQSVFKQGESFRYHPWKAP